MQEAGASLLGTHRHPWKCSAVLASLRLWFDLFFPSLISVGQAGSTGGVASLVARAFPRDLLQDLGSQAGWGLPMVLTQPELGLQRVRGCCGCVHPEAIRSPYSSL